MMSDADTTAWRGRAERADDRIAKLRAELAQHALANGGCVPGDAYRELASMFETTLKAYAELAGMPDDLNDDLHYEVIAERLAEGERLRGVIERLEIEKHDLAERLADVEELVAAMRAHGISPEARERTNALIRSLGFGGTP